MLKRRGSALIGMSLALGLLAAWVANEWVMDQMSSIASDSETEPVVVAALEIPYGTKIESRHVKLVAFPVGTRPDNAYASFEEVEGQVSTNEIARGEMIVTSRLARHESGSTLAALVASNMRAVTVRVDDVVGVAGFLLPGNRVDVLATRLNRRTRRASAETVLRNLKVLAVDQTASTDKNEPVIVRAVTLEMTPAQSETLAKSKEEGSIQLTLRNPLDNQQVVAAPKLEKKAAPKRVRKSTPSAPSVAKVTVIRGTHVDNTKAKL